jgi:hypothetical protein
MVSPFIRVSSCLLHTFEGRKMSVRPETDRRLESSAESARIPDKSVARILYRAGRPSPSNLRPRAVDQGELSFRDSLSNPWPQKSGGRAVFVPGDHYFGIDATRFPTGTFRRDPEEPGHVLGANATSEEYQGAVVERGKFSN